MIGLIVVGLIAGAMARLVVPGKQDISIPLTILIVGSFVGGFLGYLIFHTDGAFQPAGIVGPIGAIIVLLIWIKAGGRRTIRH